MIQALDEPLHSGEITRRGFLALFTKAAAASVALAKLPDLIQGFAERDGLFVPDYLLDVLPRPALIVVPGGPSLDEINEIAMRAIMPGIMDQFFKNSPLLTYLSHKSGDRLSLAN